MSNETPNNTDTQKEIAPSELAIEIVDYFDKYEMTAAEIVAVLEVAKSIVIMDCMATMIAHATAPTFAEQIVGEAIAKAKVTVN